MFGQAMDEVTVNPNVKNKDYRQKTILRTHCYLLTSNPNKTVKSSCT